MRFTWKTWNLTTHRIDSDVDEARDYVIEDLLQAERVEAAGYVDGVGECDAATPPRNLTGDPYYTDGKRAVILLSDTRTAPRPSPTARAAAPSTATAAAATRRMPAGNRPC